MPDARVLDKDRQPIPGLYACGNDMASIMRGTYPGPGTTLGPGMVFAYRAAMHAAGKPPLEEPIRGGRKQRSAAWLTLSSWPGFRP